MSHFYKTQFPILTSSSFVMSFRNPFSENNCTLGFFVFKDSGLVEQTDKSYFTFLDGKSLNEVLVKSRGKSALILSNHVEQRSKDFPSKSLTELTNFPKLIDDYDNTQSNVLKQTKNTFFGRKVIRVESGDYYEEITNKEHYDPSLDIYQDVIMDGDKTYVIRDDKYSRVGSSEVITLKGLSDRNISLIQKYDYNEENGHLEPSDQLLSLDDEIIPYENQFTLKDIPRNSRIRIVVEPNGRSYTISYLSDDKRYVNIAQFYNNLEVDNGWYMGVYIDNAEDDDTLKDVCVTLLPEIVVQNS